MKMKFRWMIISLIIWPHRTLQRSNHDSPSYMAAVVEYSPVMEYAGKENLGDINAENYLKFIDKAIGYGIDVIVFPEDSLSISSARNETTKRSQTASYIPDPAAKIIPCNDTSKRYKSSLKSISCAAKNHQIYVVINHRERVDCTPGRGCPPDGLLIFNTNVAFDREGRVVARYRKYNLYSSEHDENVTQPIPATFETDFGVTFGTFTCFDLLFQTSTLNLTLELNITDILYPTHWHSTLPYYYAVEVQAAWAYANDVNFLGSSLHDPKNSSGGSGIYLGKLGFVEIVSGNRGQNVLMIAEIPKVVNGTRTRAVNRDKLHVYEFTNEEINTKNETWIYTVPNTSNVPFELIDLNEKDQNKTICHDGLCCNFTLSIDFDRDSVKNNSNYYRYRFAVINVLPSIDVVGFQSCGIVACTNDTKDSCGRVFDDYENTITPITFTSLEITTQNITKENTLFMPMTFLQTMLPMNVTDFSFESESVSDEFFVHHMKLKNPVNNLLAFTIYGRDFAKDHVDAVPGLSSASLISPILLVAVILANTLF